MTKKKPKSEDSNIKNPKDKSDPGQEAVESVRPLEKPSKKGLVRRKC